MSNRFQIEVTAYHQELAARLALATIERSADRIVLQGSIEDARSFLQRTIFDAEVDRDC